MAPSSPPTEKFSTKTEKSTISTTTTKQETQVYFAYGSNLSLTQMRTRCPDSTYYGIGKLEGWKWIIGVRGYANVVPATDQDDEVWGMLYSLSADDECALDVSEGVPFAYVKRVCDVLASVPSSTSSSTPVGSSMGQQHTGMKIVKALVYVDVERTGEGIIWPEYVVRMNRGISDALIKGLPEEYVEGVLRRWVREEVVEDGDGDNKDDENTV